MKRPVLLIFVISIMTGIAACSDRPEDDFLPEEDTIPAHLRIGYPVQTRIIAHRGYWNTKGSAENSLTALDKAAEEGFYGSEFDVRLTADSIPIIFHDDRIQNFVIETTPYARLRDIRLQNGERIPTLQQYLDRGKGRNIQLILEVKAHRQPETDLKAVATVVSMVRDMDMEEQVDYISFSFPICREILRLLPGAAVSLCGNVPPSKLKETGITGIDYSYEVLKKYPEWIQEAKDAGMTVNVWGVNDLRMMYDFILHDVDFITTDKPATLKRMLAPY
ncbi:MAG: glycerophosphodiester phosphodiesterase [Tannerella sp.]|nr:glycerophosphodiester phosphodiesterase [Tannerella sp.]